MDYHPTLRMISDEVRQLRAIVAAQSKDLDELREFSEAERRQRDLNMADLAKTIADLELRANQTAREAEDRILMSEKRDEAHRSDLERLHTENAELRAEIDRLRRTESKCIPHKMKMTENWTQVDIGYGSSCRDSALENARVRSAVKESVSIKLARKQVESRFKLLAAYSLANLRKRRFWDPQSHRSASFVCSLVDGGYESAIP